MCQFLQNKLPEYGFQVQDYYAEDWGWLVIIENPIKALELGIYHKHYSEDKRDYAILMDVRKPSFFSFKKLKKVSREAEMKSLQTSLEDLITSTLKVNIIGISDAFPF